MLMSGISSAVLIYEIPSATEAPSQALSIVQYALLAGSLIGLVGSVAMYAREE
jgi:hypothetical protein